MICTFIQHLHGGHTRFHSIPLHRNLIFECQGLVKRELQDEKSPSVCVNFNASWHMPENTPCTCIHSARIQSLAEASEEEKTFSRFPQLRSHGAIKHPGRRGRATKAMASTPSRAACIRGKLRWSTINRCRCVLQSGMEAIERDCMIPTYLRPSNHSESLETSSQLWALGIEILSR